MFEKYKIILNDHVNGVDSTYRKCCGVRVEDVQTEFLQSLFKHDVHHGVLLTVLRVQVVDLKYDMLGCKKLKPCLCFENNV